MSASLVGSEMCIRDSLSIDPPSLGGVRSAALFCSRVGKQASGAHRRSTSVSYTHLTLPTICSV
eukprot:9156246-Alexandrium_andersonii.AAC.1